MTAKPQFGPVFLDAFLIIKASEDESMREKIVRWLRINNYAPVIHDLLLVELFRSKHNRSAKNRINCVAELAPIYSLPGGPLNVIYNEPIRIYLEQVPFDNKSFISLFLSDVNSGAVRRLVQDKLPSMEEVNASQINYKNSEAFGKLVGNFSSPKVGKTVGSLLDAKDFQIKPERYRYFEENYEALIGKGINPGKYKEFQQQTINNILDTRHADSKTWVYDCVDRYYLEWEKILDMDLHEFNSHVSFCQYLDSAFENSNLSPKSREDYFDALRDLNLSNYPGYLLTTTVQEFVNRSPSRSKGSDSFDFLNLALAPYCHLYVTDGAIVDSIKQIGITSYNIINQRTFLETIEST